MKIIIAGALTLAAFAALHLPILKKKKGIILVLYAMGMILFFAVYNVRTLDNITRFHHPYWQVVYQKAFFEDKEYPDAFLDEFFKDKTVYTPNDAVPVSDNIIPDEIEERFDENGDYWLYSYYHGVNMWNYMSLHGASIVKDDALNDVMLSGPQRECYEDLGPANDMLRYMFPLTPYFGEWGNAFYHYWFFSSFIGDSRVYVCPEELMDAGELVVIWQHMDCHDTDSYYIASKRYYDEVISQK